ncbi:hypothetical protein FHS15_005714, partial [Paenibacillus castaneae]|nr:hypothetical protein [Paenibacillus castaneae]
DVHATDAARVFRVDGSTNYKNDSQVQVEYVHSQRQTLQWWQERYLPTLPSTIAAPKKEKKAASNKGTTAKAVISNKKTTAKAVGFYNVYKLHFDRKNDLLKLIEMRNGDMPQCREYALFLYRYWDCDFTKDPEVALENTLELNTRLNPPLTEREVLISTLSAEKAWLKKLDAKEREKARLILNVLPNGMELRYPDAGYNYSNAKLIEILHITSEEQRHLSTIIGKAEKSRRATEKRREKGIQTRKSYLQEQHGKTTDKLDQLREALLKNPLASGDELAEMLGVTKPRISQLRNKL